MGLVLPAFLLFKWTCREQEVVADTAAGRAGYAMGVREREHREHIEPAELFSRDVWSAVGSWVGVGG
jgi:hypothetical protein